MALTTPQGRGLGVRFAPPDPRTWAYPHARHLFAGVPQDIDLRDRMQPVGDQGQLGSCTGWAGTAALEAKLRDGQQRSALYVYYYDRKEDGTAPNQDAGATMLGLCKALKDYGAPTEEAWDYSNNFAVEPSVLAQSLANRIDAYYQIQGTGFPLLQGLWAALEAGECCPIALYVYPSFERTGRDGKVPMVMAGEQVLGGHAITACGWFNDSSAPGNYGWVMCQNSWGTGFGDQGYIYLPAAYFTSGVVMEGWVISVAAPVPPPPEPEPEPEPDVNIEAIFDKLLQIRMLVQRAQEDRCAYEATKRQYQASMAQIMDHDIGPIADVAMQIEALLPFEPGPGPTPPAPGLAGVYGTYAGHGLAEDLYGGWTDEEVQWGPHHGLPIVAPADGRVEVYQFGTPLSDPRLWGADQDPNPEHRRLRTNWHALAEGWVCRVPEVYGAQTMYVAVFWPSAPLVIEGQRVGHLHYGHVRSDVKTGPVRAGDQFAWSHDSGIRFEPGVPNARASHTHCCAGAGTALSPNGDLPGRLAAVAQGWALTDIGFVPGPTEYLSGAYCAGRPLRDFQQAGRPVPPMPS